MIQSVKLELSSESHHVGKNGYRQWPSQVRQTILTTANCNLNLNIAVVTINYRAIYLYLQLYVSWLNKRLDAHGLIILVR